MRETAFDVKNIQKEIEKLREKTFAPDFWNDTKNAKTINQQISSYEKKLKLWNGLYDDINTLSEMVKICSNEELNEIIEIENEFNLVNEKYQKAKIDLFLSGEFDDRPAILEIKAGAGGTEAQDWADMLLRMYLRFAERMDFSADILEKTEGVEAGIKSVLVEISGPFAYGLMQGEKGTHRLVRQSPFNAKNLRQTSFAGVTVTPLLKSTDAEDISIEEKDLRIDTFRASGAGGQKVNKTSSAIRITHIPTGIVVSCQNERSQHQNKFKAMEILRAHLALKKREEDEEKALKLRGKNVEAAWGNQIKSYVLHPYKMVKDLRTNHETSNTEMVIDGDIEEFLRSFLEWKAENTNM